MLASDLACALDPVQLAQRAGLVPDPWQAEVLRATAGRLLLNVTRQGGKSSVAAVLAVHTAMYEAAAPVLILSPSQRQSVETFRKVTAAYGALGQPVPIEAESVLRLELENGSRVLALPGREQTIRGLSAVRLLIIDEAARVSDGLYQAVRPMLAVSGGRLIAMSTPAGKRGWWYQEWTGAGPWQRVEIHADACPRIPAAFLQEERDTLPQWVYEQEYCGVFHDPEGSAFSYDAIAAAFGQSVPPLWEVGA
jgi:hypothetical protein